MNVLFTVAVYVSLLLYQILYGTGYGSFLMLFICMLMLFLCPKDVGFLVWFGYSVACVVSFVYRYETMDYSFMIGSVMLLGALLHIRISLGTKYNINV